MDLSELSPNARKDVEWVMKGGPEPEVRVGDFEHAKEALAYFDQARNLVFDIGEVQRHARLHLLVSMAQESARLDRSKERLRHSQP